MEQSSNIQNRILIVEDERDISLILQKYLEASDMKVQCEPDGARVAERVRQFRPDLILLDINLPNKDGFEVLASLREESFIPIIFVTARTSDHDRIGGLNLGGDDYIVKPFNPNDVVARVKAVLRRTKEPVKHSQSRWAGIAVDTHQWRAWVETEKAEHELNLTPAEFQILAYLVENPKRVVSRATLLDHCFPDSDALERTIDSHLSHLRRKLSDAGVAKDLIKVVRGVGYRLD